MAAPKAPLAQTAASPPETRLLMGGVGPCLWPAGCPGSGPDWQGRVELGGTLSVLAQHAGPLGPEARAALLSGAWVQAGDAPPLALDAILRRETLDERLTRHLVPDTLDPDLMQPPVLSATREALQSRLLAAAAGLLAVEVALDRDIHEALAVLLRG